MNDATQLNGWYGKLPSTGDFVSRGLRHEVLQQVEEWMGNGLIQLRYRFPDWQYLFAQSQMWSFVLPSGVLGPEPLLGCIAPSSDRVGRQFPLIALRSLSTSVSLETDLPPHGRWHAAAAELVVDAHADAMSVETFDKEFAKLAANRMNGHIETASPSISSTGSDDILAVLGTSANSAFDVASTNADLPYHFSWPELLTLFDPMATRSFWWTLGGGAVSRRLAHDGALTSHLFITLFTQAMYAQNHANKI
jgi:type VI secretion system protein ImpM